MNNTPITSGDLLNSFMGSLQTNSPASITVNNTAAAVDTRPVQILLQGQAKNLDRETFSSYLSSGMTFSGLRQHLFQSASSAQTTGVTVSQGGLTSVYSEGDTIPSNLANASQLRISYSVISGRNG